MISCGDGIWVRFAEMGICAAVNLLVNHREASKQAKKKKKF